MDAKTIELESIAEEALAAMERALQQAMIELIRHDHEFVPIDEVSVARSSRSPTMGA